MTSSTRERVRLQSEAIDEFSERLRGELVRPESATYHGQRKIFNGSIDRYPALIARCAGVADVIAAVHFARMHGLLVAVRGGGHSFPGYSVCDGGIVIDLSPMKGIRVDPVAGLANGRGARGSALLPRLDCRRPR